MKSNNFKNIISEIVKNELILTEDFKTQRQKYISQGFEPQIVDKYLNDFRELKDKKYKEAADADLPNLKVPKGNDRFNIDKYNTFRELEQIVDFVAGQRKFGSANFEDIVVNGKPIFKNNDVEIYYADTPRACIQYKGNKPYGWCVARDDSGNMFYNYRLQQHEPAFYFVKRIAATNKEFSLWNVTKDVFKGSFNDKYHFFVIQVIKGANINNESAKNYIVTSAMNDGDNQMSWSDILKIAPELNGLQKIFESKPLTPEEREKIEQYQNGLSDEEFAKLPYKEKAYYIAVYVKMDQYLTDNQFAILPEDLKNNYVGLGVGLSDNQYELIKSNSKLLKRYTEITNRKGEEYHKSKNKVAFRFQQSELKILISNKDFIANLDTNGIYNLLYNSSNKDELINILISNKDFIANLDSDGIFNLLQYSSNNDEVINILISNKEFIAKLDSEGIDVLFSKSSKPNEVFKLLGQKGVDYIANLDTNGIDYLLRYSSNNDEVINILISNKEFIAKLDSEGIDVLFSKSSKPNEVFKLLGQKGVDYIAKLDTNGIDELLSKSSKPNEVFKLLGQKGVDYIAKLDSDGIDYLLRYSSKPDEIKQIISKYRPDIKLNENKRYKLTEQQFSRLIVKLNENKMKKIYKIKEDQFATIIKSKQIEKEGFDAGSQNKQVRECPYEKNSKEWNSWYDGWYKSHTNVNEAVGESDGSYQIKIKPEGSGLKSYKGLEFDNIDIYPISVNYNIKLIPYKYGYREMVISDIGGLDKLFVNISGYNKSDEYFEEDLTVPINWSLVEVVLTDEYGYLGLAPQMDVIFSDNELSISKIILYKNITL